MNEEVDLLQIRIDEAKNNLPKETLEAINAVDWKTAVLSLREKKGFNFEQLGELETETELLLCGLTQPHEYPKELQTRMRLTKPETDELVSEMNNLVFNKIKEEMIKNTERKQTLENKNVVEKDISSPEIFISPTKTNPAPININPNDAGVLKSAGIEVVKPVVPVNNPIITKQPESREELLKKVEDPEPAHTLDSSKAGGNHPMFSQKLFNPVQNEVVKTEHTLDNITKHVDIAAVHTDSVVNKSSTPKVDPYRELPE